MNMVAIYALSDPFTRLVRYVGKSARIKHRVKEHIYASKHPRTHRDRWIASIAGKGTLPIFEVLEVVPELGWEEAERHYIAWFKSEGFDLTNLTDGGEGAKKGRALSADHRFKISESNKGNIRSPEQRRNMSVALKGRKITPEAAKASADKNRGMIRSSEVRMAMSAARSGSDNAMFGKRHSAETRARISSAVSGTNHRMFGKRHSETTLMRMRHAALNRHRLSLN